LAVAERLRLSRRQRTQLADMVTQPDQVPPDACPADARRAIYRLGTALFRDLVFLNWADGRAQGGGAVVDAAFSALLELSTAWPRPDLPIKGEDALDLGLAPGPPVGEAVRRVEAWWIDEDFLPDRAACLQRLEAVIKEG
jgi:poly(A) polymerase